MAWIVCAMGEVCVCVCALNVLSSGYFCYSAAFKCLHVMNE